MTKKSTSMSTVLSDVHFKGRFNVFVLERVLILRAFNRHTGLRIPMAKDLGMTTRNLYRKIIAHNLKGIMRSKERQMLIDNELNRLKSEYPLVYDIAHFKTTN